MTYISPPNRDIAMQLHVLPFQLPEKKPPFHYRLVETFRYSAQEKEKNTSSCTPVALRALPSKERKNKFL